MKIIHFADLHIGSKFERMPDDIKTELNTKLRNAFANIIDYAKENNITTILMAGDIFDKNSVLMKDKKFFYDLIKINSEIDFYYIKVIMIHHLNIMMRSIIFIHLMELNHI